MNEHQISTLWILTIVFFSFFSVYLAGISYKRKQVHGTKELAFFLITVALYSIGVALEVSGYILPKIIKFMKFEFFWASFTAPAFLLFTLRYLKQKRLHIGIYILFLATSTLIGITGLQLDAHKLIYSGYWIEEGPFFPVIHYTPGIIYKIQLAYLILSSIAGEVILLIKAVKSRGQVRKQALIILIGGVIPTLNAILFPERIHGSIDTVPFALSITGICASIALFRYHMLDLLTIARETAVDTIQDIMLILDSNTVILDYNRSGRHSPLFHSFEVGREVPTDTEFGKYLMDIVKKSPETTFHSRNIYNHNGQHFQIKISTIEETKNKIEAVLVIIIHDITESINLMQELEEQATIDPLTETYNRRQWMNLANRELVIAGRNSRTLAVIIFDIDHFKKINDSYGHIFGDEVLRLLAHTVKQNLRVSEIFGRYGGEEFCIICGGADTATAMAIAERIRQRIETIDISCSGKKVVITASFGVFCTENSSANSIDIMLNHADKALYQAKNQGRNRCIAYTPE